MSCALYYSADKRRNMKYNFFFLSNEIGVYLHERTRHAIKQRHHNFTYYPESPNLPINYPKFASKVLVSPKVKLETKTRANGIHAFKKSQFKLKNRSRCTNMFAANPEWILQAQQTADR